MSAAPSTFTKSAEEPVLGLTRNSSGGLSALSDAQISTAIACMQQEPALDWTVKKLANRAGMSRAGFALKFKETVGQSPIEYLTRWRMLLAEDRMAGTTDSIAEIARSLGMGRQVPSPKSSRR